MREFLYYGGPILTMEEGDYAQAVLTRDGIITAVGQEAVLREMASPQVQLVDLKGRAMLPAFLDPHSHITAYAQTLAYADLSEAGCFDEILQKLSQFATEAGLGPEDWIIGFGYDHNRLRERRHPDKETLVRLPLPNPVLLAHQSGHMGVANQKALSLMAFSAGTPDPEGGKLGRNGKGELTGYLEETAFFDCAKKIPQREERECAELLSRAEKRYASCGIATLQDGLTGEMEFSMLKGCHFSSDVVCYVDIGKCPGLLEEHRELLSPALGGKPSSGLSIGGYKMILDGSPQGKTAWMSSPYEGEEEYRGYPAYTDEQVCAFLTRSAEDGVQMLAHCNGDAAAEQLIRCVKEVSRRIPQLLKLRTVMIHAQLLRPDQLEQVKELGILPSFFVAHTYHWGDTHLGNLGKRAYCISPAGSAEALGIPYTFHQDTPVLPPDMIDTLWCAVNRRTREGVLLGGEERITVRQALRAVTVNAAYQYFEERRKGSIAPGKDASFSFFSEDPLRVRPEDLRRIRVLASLCRGRVLYRYQ